MLDIKYIDRIRTLELDAVLPLIPLGARILEIGAGSGRQALEMARRGFVVEAIDVSSSDYVGSRQFPVQDYDGTTLPFPDSSFDLVYSSNVLEHVEGLPALHAEIRRVLVPNGQCVHILPTHSWRFWTSLALGPKMLLTLVARNQQQSLFGRLRTAAGGAVKRHGERGNAATELWYFHPEWWRRHFRENGFELVEARPIGLFYTAQMAFGPRLSLGMRRKLARVFGSPTHLYHLRIDR
jgi:SAM-dependent methyltransferase